MSKEKLPDEILNGIKTGKIKIKPAPQDEIMMLRPYVMRVLKAVGRPKAWVSDLSTVWDFSPADEKENREFIAKVSVKLGFPVDDKDYITELAKRLKEKEE